MHDGLVWRDDGLARAVTNEHSNCRITNTLGCLRAIRTHVVDATANVRSRVLGFDVGDGQKLTSVAEVRISLLEPLDLNGWRI